MKLLLQYSAWATALGVGSLSFSASAQTLQTLHDFTDAEIGYPGGGLVFDGTDALYGTASGGGNKKTGSIFKFVPSTGVLTTLHTFTGNDGYFPTSALVLAPSGTLYGTTDRGGPAGTGSDGTIFSFNPATGSLSTLSSFSANNGVFPFNGVTYDPVHNVLYGTTRRGSSAGWGTIYQFNPTTQKVTTLYQIPSLATGAYPSSGLALDNTGQLYGTAMSGGTGGSDQNAGGGTAYVFNPATGDFSTVYNFCTDSDCGDGLSPSGTMVVASSGKGAAPMLYGTTQMGGTGGSCPYGCGVLFQLNPATGALTVLHDFTGEDGAYPGDHLLAGGLVMDSSGRLYGTTSNDGTPVKASGKAFGTVFEYNTVTKTFATLATFTGKNGRSPNVTLALDASGDVYGETSSGGRYGRGTIFEIVP